MTCFPKALRFGISIALTCVVIVLAGVYLDWRLAINALKTADRTWLGIALALFATNWLLRTIRFHSLLRHKAGRFQSMLGITMLHGMFTYMLPAKSGELSYLLLARKHLDVTLPVSAATLIAARLLDFGVIAFLLPVAMLMLDADHPAWLGTGVLLYCVGVVCVAGVVATGLRFGSAWQPTGRSRWWHRPAQGVLSTLDALRGIHRDRQYLRLCALSFGIWVCILMQYFCITLSLGFHPEFAHMVVISVILIPLTLIPVQGIANVGTHEAAWITGLSLFDYSFDSALLLAVTSHVAVFIMFLVLGLVGYVLLRR